MTVPLNVLMGSGVVEVFAVEIVPLLLTVPTLLSAKVLKSKIEPEATVKVPPMEILAVATVTVPLGVIDKLLKAILPETVLPAPVIVILPVPDSEPAPATLPPTLIVFPPSAIDVLASIVSVAFTVIELLNVRAVLVVLVCKLLKVVAPVRVAAPPLLKTTVLVEVVKFAVA